MKKFILCLLTAFPLFANAADWNIIREKSSLTFVATQNNAPVKGKFNRFEGTIKFDPNQLKGSKIHMVVDMGSIATSYTDVANTLKTPDWFDIKVFPEAIFDAGHFIKNSDNSYTATGNLTIRDKTMPMGLTFTLSKYTDTEAVAEGTVTLRRNDFGVGQGEWKSTAEVKDDVTVKFEIAAEKK